MTSHFRQRHGCGDSEIVYGQKRAHLTHDHPLRSFKIACPVAVFSISSERIRTYLSAIFLSARDDSVSVWCRCHH
jgi:hypothetical protein